MKVLLILFVISSGRAFSQSVDQKIAELEATKKKIKNEIQILQTQITGINIQMSKLQKEKKLQNGKFIAEGELVYVEGKADLKEFPSHDSKTIATVTGWDDLYTIGFYNDYYQVECEKGTGFIYKPYLEAKTYNTLDKARENQNTLLIQEYKNKEDLEAQQIEKAKQKEIAQANEQRRTELSKKYSGQILENILSNKFWIGMTDDMAKDSIGNPKDINKTVGAWGVHEQWVYYNDLYLYFENGKLTSYQQ